MQTVKLGNAEVSRFIVGSNPFSGFSHQSGEVDVKMKAFFTAQQIKNTLFEAEGLGITTVLGRTDHHVMRVLLEYWNEGGKLIWSAQSCPEVGSQEVCVNRAHAGGAKLCHIHGGLMDHLHAAGKLADEIPPILDMIRDRGLAAGIAAHSPEVIEWAEEHLDVDYYMCSYYNSMARTEHAEHRAGTSEWFHEEDRQRMTALIQQLSKPAIHYKVLAAGRNDPAEAFAVVAKTLRPGDAVCVGIYQEDKPEMLAEDVRLFQAALEAEGKA